MWGVVGEAEKRVGFGASTPRGFRRTDINIKRLIATAVFKATQTSKRKTFQLNRFLLTPRHLNSLFGLGGGEAVLGPRFADFSCVYSTKQITAFRCKSVLIKV